jgi:outer membrane protein W
MKKFPILLLVFATFCSSSIAQSSDNNSSSFTFNRNKFSLGYEVAFPGGDYISKESWVGGRIEYSRFINDQIAVGIGASWNSFSEYFTKATYQKPDGSGAITSDHVRELYTVPITVHGRYYIKAGKTLMPYAGVGIGTQYADQTIYFNIYSIEDNNWGFVVRPEIGVAFPFSNQTALYLSGTYNYATNKNDAFKIDNLQHFAISVGFTFGSR